MRIIEEQNRQRFFNDADEIAREMKNLMNFNRIYVNRFKDLEYINLLKVTRTE